MSMETGPLAGAAMALMTLSSPAQGGEPHARSLNNMKAMTETPQKKSLASYD